MSKKVKVTAKARKDLINIGQYTELKWGKNQRNHYLKQLDVAFNLIGEHPKIGKDRSHVLSGYRSYQQNSHMIYYKVREAIEIIRILHKRMDVKNHVRKT